MRKITDPGKIGQNIYDEAAQVQRIAESGHEWTPAGALGTTAKRVGEHRSLTVYNPTGAVVLVKFGDQTVTAPATAADGFPILAGEKCVLSSGEKAYIRASATGLFIYTSPES